MFPKCSSYNTTCKGLISDTSKLLQFYSFLQPTFLFSKMGLWHQQIFNQWADSQEISCEHHATVQDQHF